MISEQIAEKDTQALLQAFSSFAEVSHSLETAYLDLDGQVKELSRELEESNHYLSSLLQSLPCGILVVKAECVTTVNRQARCLLSLAKTGLPRRLDEMFEKTPHGEKLKEIFQSRDQPGEISLSGKEPRILTYSWAETRNGELILMIQDVTAMRLLERKMQKSQRLAAMGEMAVELAHEIRNPLAGLELFASLLREETLPLDQRQSYLDNIQIGIRSLNTVVTNMLCFSRQPVPVKKPVVLAQLLEEIASVMAVLLKQRGILLLEDYQDRGEVMGDREMLRQVFTNLILNAMQALPEGGKIEFSTSSHEKGVVVVIRDDGIGIPEELQETIFEPHFTTNPRGQGLGLAIVKSIIGAHQGRIELKTGKDWGTRFTLVFPR